MTQAASTPEYYPTGVPTGRVGIWWFLSSELAIFGGLIVTFVLCQQRHSVEWASEATHTITWAGALNTFVLLTSSFIVVKAHEKAHHGDTKGAGKLMLATVGCGLVFLVVKAYEYTHEISAGLVPDKSMFWSFYYLMTGLHALHVIAGMVAMVVIARGLLKGLHPQRAEYVGMYWHVVDVVWIFLFPLLYLGS